MGRRTLWITGGGSGMGQAVAEAAGRAGWNVAVSGRRADALNATVDAIAAIGGVAAAVPVDVADRRSLESGHDAVHERFGGIDDLVVAAGVNSPRRSWNDQDLDEFDAIIHTNLTAAAQTVALALPTVRLTSGNVVVISSHAGWTFSDKGGVAYSASKTALGSLCRSINSEEQGGGARATHLCPGDVDTPFLSMRPNVPDEEARAAMLTPEDVARAVLFVLKSPHHVRIDELVITPAGPGRGAR